MTAYQQFCAELLAWCAVVFGVGFFAGVLAALVVLL